MPRIKVPNAIRPKEFKSAPPTLKTGGVRRSADNVWPLRTAAGETFAERKARATSAPA